MVCVNDNVELNCLNPNSDAQKYLPHFKLSSVMARRSLAGFHKHFGGTHGVHLNSNNWCAGSIFLRKVGI